jgi:hypoxanthine-DNA glycosylase
MDRISGFEPLAAQGARMLVLGSMPSVASLEKHQYYGKPQNAFWKIMGELFAAGPELPYDERVLKLTQSGVAVWDVLASCVRPGSLDSAIDMTSVKVNAFIPLLRRHDEIERIYFNGRKAEALFRRHALVGVHVDFPDIELHVLPSTSPAMATLNFAAKLERWRVLSG